MADTLAPPSPQPPAPPPNALDTTPGADPTATPAAVPASAPVHPLDATIAEADRLGGPLASALIGSVAGAHIANQQSTAPAPANANQTMDPAQSVLERAGNLDKQTKHDAWDAYHNAKDTDELERNLQNSPLPRQVKHDLWEAKHTEGLLAATKSNGMSDDEIKGSVIDALGNTDLVPGGQMTTGFLKGVGDTAYGVGKLIPGVKDLLPAQEPGYLKSSNPAQSVGKVGENIAEFAAGDAALEGALKFANLAKNAPEAVAFIEKFPKAARTVMSAIAKGGIVGGAQGAAKGSAEGDAVGGAGGGALGGAIGGGLGAAVAETAGAIAKPLAEKFGIGTEATEDAARGARPAKRNYRFADDFVKAAPRMDAENAITPARTVEDWADNTKAAREKLYADEIQPLVDRHANEALDGAKIADQIRNGKLNPATGKMEGGISEEMRNEDPDEAAKMEQLANKFMAGSQNVGPQTPLRVENAESRLQYYNAKLASTGFWSKSPAERAAKLKTDGTVAGLKAAGDAIRDELYNKLEALEPGSDVRGLKQEYGALRNVEDEIRGRINVNNRQVPISLKETIGLITGLGHGGPVGAAMAAIPVLDRFGNSPENLIARGVQKAARPGEEGLVSRAVQGVGRATKAAIPVVSQAGGAATGQALFTASDGSTHSIPDTAEGRAAVLKIDPAAKFAEPKH